MRTLIKSLLLALCFTLLAGSLQAQRKPAKPRAPKPERISEELERAMRVLEAELARTGAELEGVVLPELAASLAPLADLEVHIPEIDIDLSGLEHMLEDMDFDFDFDFDFPEIHVPDIDIDIDIPDVPDADFDFRVHFGDEHAPVVAPFSVHMGGNRLFRNLGDDERLKIQAIRALPDDADAILSALQKVLRSHPSPAVRYMALRKVSRLLPDERVVPILIDRADDDANIEVRKLAIRYLGRTKDMRALEYLRSFSR